MSGQQEARRAVRRARWAAIGAALAVAVGGSGWYMAHAATGASAPSAFVAIDPVRILDTRFDAGLSGTFTSDAGRDLQVTGTVEVVTPGNIVGTGSPVPLDATAIVANVTVVAPSSTGYVSVRPGGTVGVPTTSTINIATTGANVANSVTVRLSGSGDLNLWYHGQTGTAHAHVLLDVVGYYRTESALGGTIPGGTTVTGVYYWDGHQQTLTTGSELFSVDLPGTAPVALTPETVNFAAGTGAADADAACTGTLTAPTAPAGKVCVYAGNVGGVNMGGTSAYPSYLPARSFLVGFSANGTSGIDEYLYITWAYTAP